MAVKVLLLLLNFVYASHSANILAVVCIPSHSHQVVFAPLWKELSLRGHRVTVVTTDPVQDSSVPNMTEIDLKWSYKHFANITQSANAFSMWNLPATFSKYSVAIAEEQLSHPSIQALIHDQKEKFDVVLTEYYCPEYFGFSVIHECPKILISPVDPFAHVHGFLGNPSHPIIYPELGTPYFGTLSFMERVKSSLYSLYLSQYYLHKTYPQKENVLQKYFNSTVSMMSLLYDVDLMIVNVNPLIHNPRANGPTTINMGGFRDIPATVTLPKDLQNFLDNAKDGFIYFSLGSNVKSKDLGQQTLDSIMAALSEVPYKVLWKFEADVLPGKPSNVKLIKWAPQQHILAHPNIKLFVTQGGLQSMEEGIYSEVPFVVIPFFADQQQNANLMQIKGMARVIDRKPFIKKDALKTAILEVIHNPSYKAAVQNLKRLALDAPMTGLEKAVWWTEYVIRNNGTKHLRNPAADISSYQYYLLDVIGFLTFLTVLCIWLVVAGLQLLFRLLCSQYVWENSSKLKEQ